MGNNQSNQFVNMNLNSNQTIVYNETQESIKKIKTMVYIILKLLACLLKI